MSHYSRIELKEAIVKAIFESRKTQSKRLHALTNMITSDIMRLIHGKEAKLPSSSLSKDDIHDIYGDTGDDEFFEIVAGKFPLSLDWRSQEYSYDISDDIVDTTLYVTVQIDRDAKRYNVSGYDKDPTGMHDLGIHIVLEIPSHFLQSEYGALRNEISNTVRHEIEHVTQGESSGQLFIAHGRGDEYYNFIHKPADVESRYARYLLKPEEIPSHVRGYSQNVKNINDLKRDIHILLNRYQDMGLISDWERGIIFDTWIDWAQKTIKKINFQN